MSLAVQDLGWMAGVLDLKAKFLFKKNKDLSANTGQVVMYVESVQTGVVKKLATLTGTKAELTEKYPDKEGFWQRECSEHCDEAHVHVQTERSGRPGSPATIRSCASGPRSAARSTPC